MLITESELIRINEKRRSQGLPALSIYQADEALRRKRYDTSTDQNDTLTNILIAVTVAELIGDDSNATVATSDGSFDTDKSQFDNTPSGGDYTGGGASGDWSGVGDAGSGSIDSTDSGVDCGSSDN